MIPRICKGHLSTHVWDKETGKAFPWAQLVATGQIRFEKCPQHKAPLKYDTLTAIEMIRQRLGNDILPPECWKQTAEICARALKKAKERPT